VRQSLDPESIQTIREESSDELRRRRIGWREIWCGTGSEDGEG